jgi:hypothetical protein
MDHGAAAHFQPTRSVCTRLYCAAMSVRVNLRLPDDLWGGVCTAADGAGQTRTMFVRRALEAALSEAKGSAIREQAGPGPVPSEARNEGVRPAAPPRAPEPESKPMSADELRAWKRAQSNRGGRGVA